ncbi:MAG TPA: SDR family oxidoreductase [Thermodesulfobacteriota bacterium]
MASGRQDLKGQVAIITGASSGIGAAVARDLAEAGMRLVVTARREERLRALAEETGAVWLAGDITAPDLPVRLLDTALGRFGRVDVVFNNAGVMDAGPVEAMDVEQIARMVRVNVEAAFRVAYHALVYFKREDRGTLVNVSSILGTRVRPHVGWYAGTKFAVEGLTEALRMEFAGTNVRITAIQPGSTLTELQDHWPAHARGARNRKAPLLPEDIARIVRFVLEQPPHVRIPRVLAVPAEQGTP